MSSIDCDIAIIGAGPTGLALALALREGPWRVKVFDGAASASAGSTGSPASADPRALALSEGTRQLLTRLDAWPGDKFSAASATAFAMGSASDSVIKSPPSSVTAICNIDISQQGGQARAGLYAESLGLGALGHVVRYGELLNTLRARAEEQGIEIISSARAGAIETAPDGTAWVHFDNDTRVHALLVVHAEGTHDDQSWQRDYAQTAIICEATPTLPHHHLAYERFTPDGPLALLPLESNYAIVRVVNRADRDEWLALEDAVFTERLTQALGHRVAFSAVGPRSAFPLTLKIRHQLHQGREVWIGNAAQTLHPVSGQGFNLGLRDAWTLAEALHEALITARNDLQKKSANATLTRQQAVDTPALNSGKLLENARINALDTAVLARWARTRQPDRLATTLFTDGIVRLFSNDIAPLRQARDLGLRVLDTLPGLRNFIARRMIWGTRGW